MCALFQALQSFLKDRGAINLKAAEVQLSLKPDSAIYFHWLV